MITAVIFKNTFRCLQVEYIKATFCNLTNLFTQYIILSL